MSVSAVSPHSGGGGGGSWGLREGDSASGFCHTWRLDPLPTCSTTTDRDLRQTWGSDLLA